MNWSKEYCDIENKWLIGTLQGGIFETKFVFDTEDIADLMLFCLERVIN